MRTPSSVENWLLAIWPTEATARKYYFLSEKSKESVEASKKLGDLMRDDGKEDGETETEINDEKVESDPIESNVNKKVPWNGKDFEKVIEVFEKEIAASTDLDDQASTSIIPPVKETAASQTVKTLFCRNCFEMCSKSGRAKNPR